MSNSHSFQCSFQPVLLNSLFNLYNVLRLEKSTFSPGSPASSSCPEGKAFNPRSRAFHHTCINGVQWFVMGPRLVKIGPDDENLLWYPSAFLISRAGVGTEMQKWTICPFPVASSASWTKHVWREITIWKETARKSTFRSSIQDLILSIMGFIVHPISSSHQSSLIFSSKPDLC